MKWASIIAVIVLSLALAGETIFLIKQLEEKEQIRSQAFITEQKLRDSENKNKDISEEIGGLKKEVAEISQEKDEQMKKVTELEEMKNGLNTEKEKLTKNLKEKTDQVWKLTNEGYALKKKFMCETTLSNVDFTSNETVNKSLKKYVTDTKNRTEDVSASYWNLIWTGKKYSIHTVEVFSEKDRMNYIWKFTAYFRGEAYGDHENGIFYNDNQCWMYLDK